MAQLVLITPVSLAGAGLTPTPTGGAEAPAAAPFLANVTVLQAGGPPERPHPLPPPGLGGPGGPPEWGIDVPVDPGYGRPDWAPVRPDHGLPGGRPPHPWLPGFIANRPPVDPGYGIELPPQPPTGGPPPEGTTPIWVFVPGHGAVGPIFVPKPGGGGPGKPEPK